MKYEALEIFNNGDLLLLCGSSYDMTFLNI